MKDQRLIALMNWIRAYFKQPNLELSTVSDDASFRRYFRVFANGKSWIAVDAPPDKEDCKPFVAIAEMMKVNQVQVPVVHQVDWHNGFMLLDDFGDKLLMPEVKASPLAQDMPSVDMNVDVDNNALFSLYCTAQSSLAHIAKMTTSDTYCLPAYDEALLRREMNLLTEWFFPYHLGYALSNTESQVVVEVMDALVSNALSQPMVGVHRDFHSRNIMLLSEQPLGVIDFQDAVHGPITYDLVSLLRDCYVVLPDRLIDQLVEHQFHAYQDAKLLPEATTLATFTRWFDLMGLQRHIKVLGIFARLHYRDNKSGYLADLPRVFAYVLHVAQRYPQFDTFTAWMKNTILPLLNSKQQQMNISPTSHKN